MIMRYLTTAAQPSFKSQFRASRFAEYSLRSGKIIDEKELPAAMIERVVNTLFDVELSFQTPSRKIKKLKENFGYFLDNKYCVMSTPIMTNAGRYKNRPLSACTVPPVSLKEDKRILKKVIDQFHQDGMGTGFSLDDTQDPIRILKFLNNIALAGAKSGKEDRPVGNMATLAISHPRIADFIDAKINADSEEAWKFNISVDINDDFINAVKKEEVFLLKDGKKIDARKTLNKIAQNAATCGDPGLVFMNRFNKDNPTPGVGEYVSTAPCGEVGLAPGESCQFGYINLGRFVEHGGSIDYKNLEKLVRLLTRSLDNALEISINRFSHEKNRSIMKAKRKIGIGVCGLADMLLRMKIPYASPEARNLTKNIIIFINFFSKDESCELAKKRGSFTAMHIKNGCQYNNNPGFLEEKYGKLETELISRKMWLRLGEKIRSTQCLRNASTIALPPTGRSSLVIDASAGIEPIFSLTENNGRINKYLHRELKKVGIDDNLIKTICRKGTIADLDEIPDSLRECYKTAIEIDSHDHLSMVEAIQGVIDESISKTINLPNTATAKEVEQIFLKAHTMGLKGVTVFRMGSRKMQPKVLANINK